jgi:hypothetical protein
MGIRRDRDCRVNRVRGDRMGMATGVKLAAALAFGALALAPVAHADPNPNDTDTLFLRMLTAP